MHKPKKWMCRGFKKIKKKMKLDFKLLFWLTNEKFLMEICSTTENLPPPIIIWR